MSLLKTKKDKDLFAKWNKKLEKYDDCNAEDFTLPEPALKAWHNFKFKNINPDDYRATLNYYDSAKQFLLNHKFKKSIHRKIWELHIEGVSNRKIEKVLKNKIHRLTIDKVVKELQCLMLK